MSSSCGQVYVKSTMRGGSHDDKKAALFEARVVAYRSPAGDLGGDGLIELILGAPESDSGDALGAGAVHIFSASLRGVHYPTDAEGHIGL